MLGSDRAPFAPPPAPRPIRRAASIFAVALGALLTIGPAGSAEAQAQWLDAPPRAWNSPPAQVPAAPPLGAVSERCPARGREASSAEEAQVAAADWQLQQYWPTQRRNDLVLVLATASFDGMCRPWQYNGFAFVGGQFAGTLSPEHMNSRFDGALSATLPAIVADGRIEAVFLRYAPTDPLCCPSRPPTRVSYRTDRSAAGAALVPDRITTAAAGPAELPRTGDPAPWAPVSAMGIALVVAGVALRRHCIFPPARLGSRVARPPSGDPS